MAGLGAQQQALQGRDVGQLLGIGGLQQAQAQRQLDVNTANLAAIENAPFQQLSLVGILQQLSVSVEDTSGGATDNLSLYRQVPLVL